MKRTCLMIAWLLTACIACAQQNLGMRYATFNIRYDNPQDEADNWRFRKDSVCHFVQAQQLDVVGMQEVLHNQCQDLLRGLPAYAMVGVGRDDGKQQGEYAPIFYRADRFDVLDSNTFWLSQYPDSVGFIGWDGACTRIATWAKLRDKQTGRVFMAVNTHFDHVGTTARRQGALLIISRIQQIAGNLPTILTGDFNVDEKSEAYRTITTNKYVLLDAQKVARKTEGVKYTFHDFGRIPEAEREKIDFIFVSRDIAVERSFIPHCSAQGRPYLSDHQPQIVDLKL